MRHFTVLQRVVGIDGTQAGLLPLLDEGFRRLGDKNICVALQNFVEDPQVVLMDCEIGGLEAGAREALVAAPQDWR